MHIHVPHTGHHGNQPISEQYLGYKLLIELMAYAPSILSIIYMRQKNQSNVHIFLRIAISLHFQCNGKE